MNGCGVWRALIFRLVLTDTAVFVTGGEEQCSEIDGLLRVDQHQQTQLRGKKGRAGAVCRQCLQPLLHSYRKYYSLR